MPRFYVPEAELMYRSPVMTQFTMTMKVTVLAIRVISE